MIDKYRFASYDPELRRQIGEFHQNADKTLVVPIIRRIINHYLPKDKPIPLDAAIEGSLTDLGLDSLTLLEVTMDVQDAFDTTFTDEELRGLQSFSQITALIDRKIQSLSSGEA